MYGQAPLNQTSLAENFDPFERIKITITCKTTGNTRNYSYLENPIYLKKDGTWGYARTDYEYKKDMAAAGFVSSAITMFILFLIMILHSDQGQKK